MDIRNRLLALWWADHIYRELNRIEACDNTWLSQAFYIGGTNSAED